VSILKKFHIKNWNGLQFMGAADAIDKLDGIPKKIKTLIDFKSSCFGHVEVHECGYNWKTFLEFYLEDYHVASFHPGLGHFISCDHLQWSFGESWSAQTVSFFDQLKQPGNCKIYQSWHEAVRKYYSNELPSIGAMWLLIYPNTMIEWYPLVTVISTVYPKGTNQCVNVVEYYHPRDLMSHPDGKAMASLAASAYLETALEDNQIGERIQEGRFALMNRGVSEFGPYQEQLEAGMVHFHRFLHECLGHI
jgi:choline monooxygenase